MTAIQIEKRKTLQYWQAIRELAFISHFFSWLFLLASRLAEPFMLLSVIYVVIEAGLPGTSVAFLHNLSLGVMIAAPEIILPGSFVLVSQEKTEGKDTRLLFTICWVFVILTLITLLSLFVFHLDHQAINLIMFLRCATGVGYSILIRIATHQQNTFTQPTQQPQAPQALEITPAQIALIIEQAIPHVSGMITTTIQQELEATVSKLAQSTNQLSTATPVPENGKTKTAHPVLKNAVGTANTKSTPVPAQEPTDNITPISGKVSDEQIREAYAALLAERTHGKVTADALRVRAKIGKTRACQGLRINTDQAQEASA